MMVSPSPTITEVLTSRFAVTGVTEPVAVRTSSVVCLMSSATTLPLRMWGVTVRVRPVSL